MSDIMKKQWKLGRVILGVILCMLVAIPGYMEVVAASLDTSYATKEELLSNYNLSGGIVASLKYGANEHTWLIAGKDNDDELVCLSSSSFETSIYGINSLYIESVLKNLMDQYTGDTTYFSEGEKTHMKIVEVKTEDAQGSVHNDSGYLYAPDTPEGRNGRGSTSISVGSSNDIEIPLNMLIKDNGFDSICFWLRSPREDRGSYAQLANPDGKIGSMLVGDAFGVLPAMHLDLSMAVFASKASAASEASISENNELTVDDAMTIRFDAGKTLGSAKLSEDGKSITLKKVPSDTYLVVQSSNGVYAKKLEEIKENMVFEANSITINAQTLDTFNECKVWLEATDDDRITMACLASAKNEQTSLVDVRLVIGIGILVIITGIVICMFRKKE